MTERAPHSTLRWSTLRWTAVAVLPAVLLAAWQASWPFPFFSDDSFISLRYSERLLQGDGLTFTDVAGVPERVEGYSNLLWVLLTAALGGLGLELVTAARVLGAVCTLAALWLLAAALRPRDARSALVASVAPLLVASTQPVMIWTLAGLEGPLVLALLAWGFGGLVQHHLQPRSNDAASDAIDSSATTSRRPLLLLGVPFALLCWTRPDGPLWALTAGTGLACLSLQQGLLRGCSRAFWFGLPAVLAVAMQLAFRSSYYGDYLPNTAHVKAEFDPASWPAGYAFVSKALLAMPGLALAMLLGAGLLLLHRKTRALTTVLALPVLAWLSYLMAIGGDHFPGLRLLHGALVPMALLAAVGVHSLNHPTLRVTFAALLAISASVTNVYVARHDPRSLEARSEQWEWHAKVLGETLQRAFHEQQPRIAVDAAGALPFYSKLPVLDMLGLCDRTIATTPFPAWIDTVRAGIPKPPGHMRGNGEYVIAQQPDLLTFQHAPGLPLPVFVSACEFEADPRFLEHYRCVLLDLGNPEILPGVRQAHLAPLWVRVEGRAGITRSDARITVPAYLFGSFQLTGPAINRHQPPTGDAKVDGEQIASLNRIAQFWNQRRPVAKPNADGTLGLFLAPQQAESFSLQLPAGTYRVSLLPEGPAGNGATLHATAAAEFASGVLTVASDSVVTLELRASSNGADEDAGANPERMLLESIVLDRTR